MELIFSKEDQQKQFELAKSLFLNIDYNEAEPLLNQIIYSASQKNYYDIYVNASIWLNRLYINTIRYEEVYKTLITLYPIVHQHAEKEELLFYKLQHILFNSHYFIGDTLTEMKLFLEDPSVKEVGDLYYIVGNNLLYEYILLSDLDNAYSLFKTLDIFSITKPSFNKLIKYIYGVHGFILHYALKDYDTCASILHTIESDPSIKIPDSFKMSYDISKVMLDAQQGKMDEAIVAFRVLFDSNPYYFNELKFNLREWIKTLAQHNYKDEIIYYQSRIIELMETQYSKDIRTLRKESIEHHSKQFYETQIYTDQMTCVKNRNFFEVYLEELIHLKHYTVVVLDIDKFKIVNDTYGHPIGDEAIKLVAKTLKDWTPYLDVNIIRIGGDEFVLLLPYPFEKVHQSIVDLHAKIKQTPLIIEEENVEIPLSVSMGICYTGQQGASLKNLYEQADDAIYEAKKERGRIWIQAYQTKFTTN